MKINGKSKEAWEQELASNAAYFAKDKGGLFLSNSNIGTLESDPASFGLVEREITPLPMLLGSVMHDYLQDKITGSNEMDKYTIVDEDREFMEPEENVISADEYIQRSTMAEAIFNTATVQKILEAGDFEVERPTVGYIYGAPFKCKCDLISHKFRTILDWKSTTQVSRFVKDSFAKYNYNSAFYIYKELNPGYDMCFVAVDPKFKTRIYSPPDYQYYEGRERAASAIKNWNMFCKTDTDAPEETGMELDALPF